MYAWDAITVGISDTESDLHLLQYAAMLAAKGIGREWRFLHVAAAGTTGRCPTEILESMRRQVSDVWGELTSRVEIVCDVSRGVRLDEMLAYIARHPADVVLLGHRRQRSGKRSLARRVAMLSPSSVWMVPEGVPCQIEQILASVDFSGHSANSLSLATDLASRLGLSECLAGHVFFESSTIRYDESLTEIQGDESSRIGQFLSTINLHNIKVVPAFEEANNVTTGLLRMANEHYADLIVMSTRGRSTAASILLGSETSQMLMESQIPVLAVKHAGAHLNLLDLLVKGELWSKPSAP